MVCFHKIKRNLMTFSCINWKNISLVRGRVGCPFSSRSGVCTLLKEPGGEDRHRKCAPGTKFNQTLPLIICMVLSKFLCNLQCLTWKAETRTLLWSQNTTPTVVFSTVGRKYWQRTDKWRLLKYKLTWDPKDSIWYTTKLWSQNIITYWNIQLLVQMGISKELWHQGTQEHVTFVSKLVHQGGIW